MPAGNDHGDHHDEGDQPEAEADPGGGHRAVDPRPGRPAPFSADWTETAAPPTTQSSSKPGAKTAVPKRPDTDSITAATATTAATSRVVR